MFGSEPIVKPYPVIQPHLCGGLIEARSDRRAPEDVMEEKRRNLSVSVVSTDRQNTRTAVTPPRGEVRRLPNHRAFLACLRMV